MQLPSNKKIYFASDQHFGAPTAELSFPREQKFDMAKGAVKEHFTDHKIFYTVSAAGIVTFIIYKKYIA
jgi:hypothetical protein